MKGNEDLKMNMKMKNMKHENENENENEESVKEVGASVSLGCSKFQDNS